MKTKAFLFVVFGVFLVCTSAMAGNFWVGKIPEVKTASGFADFSETQLAQSSESINNERNGDPCQLLDKWGLILDKLKNGNGEHGLTPAEAIVLATEENDGNVVTMLAKAEVSQRLISVGQKWNNDFEYRLLESMSYGANQSDRCRWYGYVPNMVGESYQNALEESRGLTFEEAFAKSTDGQGNWQEFQNIYANLARFMDKHLGLNRVYSPRPSSSGYYHDFSVTSENLDKYIAVVQLLFEIAGSPLADKDLFKKTGTPSIINYDAPEKFCQCQ